MKKLLFILFISLMYYTPSTAFNCTSEDIEYAKNWDNYYKPQEAYDFGIKIQNIIKAKDLEGLFSLVKGELQSGPRRSFIKNKSFDKIFTEEWVNSLLSSSPNCSPQGWRGFMLDSGKIWYNKSDQG